MFKGTRWLILSLILVFILAACGGSDKDDDEKDDKDAADTSGKPTVILGSNSWLASELNVAVAKIIIEKELGYPVDVVPAVDEFEQWDLLASGEIHASLEVWPSGHADNRTEYVDNQQTVEFGGELGPIGKIGWYVPTYVLQDYPELATYEGFRDTDQAALFATDETGDNGRFVAGNSTWTQYDAQIIDNLDLNLQVVPVDDPEAETIIIDMVRVAFENEDPILFYFWTPHWIHALYNLQEVELPEYSEACYAAEEGVACDYPEDRLFKIFWPGLAEYAPPVHDFLANMNYSNPDQIAMMAAVEINDKSIDQAAQEWVDNNEDVWRAWLPE